jgi:hypothetical protein
MSLVNIGTVQRQVLQMLTKIDAPAGIELSSYKRNRSISITLLPGGQFAVREHGYVEQELEVDDSGLSKLLKTLIKREFPRSRKVRLHKFSHPDELDRQRKTL